MEVPIIMGANISIFTSGYCKRILNHIYGRFVAWFVKSFYCSRAAGGDDLKRLGSTYGGWWVRASLLSPDSWALCCGAGEDVSFDVALNAEYGMRVICVDPTPRAITHVNRILDPATQTAQSVPEHEFLAGFDPSRFWFVPNAVWSSKDVLKFYEPENPQHVSHSAVNLQRTQRFIEVTAETPAAILSRHGVGEVSLVKLDIEGAEYEVLTALLNDGILPRQLMLEFDELHHPLSWRYPGRVLQWVRRLAGHGYQLMHVEGSNFLFVKEPLSG